jgi:hypothetical protein
MPFSLIAIILVLLSSISAALITDLRDKSDGAELTMEGLERMDELSQEARDDVEGIAFQTVLGICSGDTSNESRLVTSFETRLSNVISDQYPQSTDGHLIEVDASGIHLSFLRLSLSDNGEGWEGTYIPAYIGLCGRFQVKVGTDDGNLTRNYTVATDTKVPWPLLNDRMESFSSSVSDNMGDLSTMTKAMLDALSEYRSLQGWGTMTSDTDERLDDMITERDVINALDLGLIIIQFKTFRNATPCMDISTDHMDGQEAWSYVLDQMMRGGTIDPMDIFLSLYGYEELNWGEVFSQAIYAAMERVTLRWIEGMHMIDLINIAESIGDQMIASTNDLIEWVTGTDLVEDQYKDWIMDKFKDAGMSDALYRYLGAGGSESTVSTPSAAIQLLDGDGEAVLLRTSGEVSMDLPMVDILDWDGWGEFKDRYELGTKELLQSMRQSLAVMAESISKELYVPTSTLDLDPRDGVSFIDEVRSKLNEALANKEEWLRPAISAGERYVSAVDPLAEATCTMFKENIDTILGRSDVLDEMVSSVAEQVLTDIQGANPEIEIPWDDNVALIEQAIKNDAGWAMMDEITATYDTAASYLVSNFCSGMEYQPVISGHTTSFITTIIVNTGDPLIGLSSVLRDDVDSLLNEISGCMEMRGDDLEMTIPKDETFILIDDGGTPFLERLDVDIIYPSNKSVGQSMRVFVVDPSSYLVRSDDCPQMHDTDLMNKKWASYQSVWALVCAGRVEVAISPAGDAGNLLSMEMEQEVKLSISQSLTILTGQPLSGVEYRNINTLYDSMVRVMEEILRPLREGIEAVSSGLQKIYRMLVDTVKRLLDMGTKALDALVKLVQGLLEKVQDFVSDSVSGLKAKIVETVANVLGEKTYAINLFGLDLVIKVKPKDLASKSTCVPVSFSLSLEAGECAISVTSRLIKSDNDYGFLTNATLAGNDWAVYIIIDPFMDIFSHMVEVRGVMNGACIELVMPEMVTYQEVTLALSDIPGMDAFLSNIPSPIPGLKGSVDAGITIKVLTGRTDGVVINEYELNPAGEDRGKEWVELYNPTNEAIDLAGWSLQTEHGVQSISSLGSAVLMPKGRLVYYFADQALDNMGSGFPFEESIVLLDNHGRHVDSTPFSTDYWNDKRTWQRAQDGTDRWEFKDNTKGSRNGLDAFSRLDLTAVQDAYLSAVTESLNQLTSLNITMKTLAGVLSSALLHLGERLASTIMGLEIEMALFVQVAMTDYTSSAKIGMKETMTLHCGTVGDVLRYLAGSVAELISCFGDPYDSGTNPPSVTQDVWIGVHSYASLGLPKMISTAVTRIKVQYVTSIEANIAALSAVLGDRDAGWGIEGGVCIKGIPSSALNIKNVAANSLVSLWLCKASIHEMTT